MGTIVKIEEEWKCGWKNRQIGVGVKIGPGGLRAGATVKSGPEPLKEHLGCTLCGIVGDNLYQYRPVG